MIRNKLYRKKDFIILLELGLIARAKVYLVH